MSYTLLATERWNRSPVIDISIYYDHRRTDGVQRYRFKFSVSPLPTDESHYYGYNIKQQISLDGTTLTADYLKQNTPSRWDNPIVKETDWLNLEDKSAGTTAAEIKITSNYSSLNKTYSYSLLVDEISDIISAPTTGTLGTAFTVTVTKKETRHVNTITISFPNGTTDTIAEESAGTSFSYTPPISAASGSPYSTSTYGIITCETYDGDTYKGSSKVTIALAIPASVVPQVNVAVTDVYGYYTRYGGFVKGKSLMSVYLTGVMAYSSPIMSYMATYNGISLYAQSSQFTTSDANKITARVTDGRGRIGLAEYPITVLDYSVPTISNFSAYRCTDDGTPDDEGEYIKIVGDVSVSPLNNRNTKNCLFIYKKTTDSSYTTITATMSTYSETVESDPIAADVSASYICGIRITDDFSSIDRTGEVGIAFVLMHWRNTGKGIAFGTYSTEDNMLINMDVHITGDLTVDGSYPSGGGGTSNYNQLTNKPQINSVELSGNKSLVNLGIQQLIDSAHKLSLSLVSGYEIKQLTITDGGVTTTYYLVSVNNGNN